MTSLDQVCEVKAIMIGAGGENPDPFLEVQLGRDTNIQMRNMVPWDAKFCNIGMERSGQMAGILCFL